MEKRIGKILRKKWLLILILFVILFPLVSSSFVKLASYVSAYEGVKVRFHGLYVPRGDHGATLTLPHTTMKEFEVPSSGYYVTSRGASQTPDGPVVYNPPSSRFDTIMKFDLYDQKYWSCDLIGEMTTPTVPTAPRPDYVPAIWWGDPVQADETYEWKIDNNDGTHTIYTMTKFVVKWFFSISAKYDTGPQLIGGDRDESLDRRYSNVEVWFRLDVNDNAWYFDRQPDRPYFAIAKIELLDNVRLRGWDKDNPQDMGVSATQYVDVAPMSIGSVLTIYPTPFEDVGSQDESPTYYNFRDTRLNPQYFRDVVYAHFDLTNFGTEQWTEWFDAHAKGDVVTVGCNIHVFVFGEWRVRDTAPQTELEDYSGRTPQVAVEANPLTGLARFITETLTSPLVWAGMGGFLIILFVIIFMIALFWFFGAPRGRKRRETGEG